MEPTTETGKEPQRGRRGARGVLCPGNQGQTFKTEGVATEWGRNRRVSIRWRDESSLRGDMGWRVGSVERFFQDACL